MINPVVDLPQVQSPRPQVSTPADAKENASDLSGAVPTYRPVEKSAEGSESQAGKREDETVTTKNKLENGKIVFERYNKDGTLIQKIPPGYVPVSEMV